MAEVREYCHEWVDDKNDRCNAPAEFLLWGKLFPPEGLGPRCYDHAAKHAGHQALSDRQLEQTAILDLRGLQRADTLRDANG
jgi:hypothetical protein